MVFIHPIGFVGTAVIKMDAEMAVEIIVCDGVGAVGHAVHGSGVNMAVVQHQNCPAVPAPAAAINGFEGGGISGCQGLAVQED